MAVACGGASDIGPGHGGLVMGFGRFCANQMRIVIQNSKLGTG